MAICIDREAQRKLASLVTQAAADKSIRLLDGEETVALVPAHAVDRRLAASEKTPAAPWAPGDAGRIAKQVLRRKPVR